MTVTPAHISEHLTRLGLEHRVDGNVVHFGIATRTYRCPSGQPGLRIAVEVSDRGSYLSLMAPVAFVVEGDHAAAVFETCLRFQYLYRLLRFEFDPTDGELRLSAHIPLHDGTLGDAQFDECLMLLIRLAERVYPILMAAMTSGEVMPFETDRRAQRIGQVVQRLAELSADELETLLAALRDDDPSEGDGEGSSRDDAADCSINDQDSPLAAVV